MNPKISVIIPVYNAENYLERCFDSILKNNYNNLEIIPINDGSLDNSQSIIDRYKEKYPRTFFPIKQKNQGIGAARNKALSKVTGDYVMFIDNDDFIDEDYFNSFINELDDNYDIVLSGYRRVNDYSIEFSVSLKDYPWSKYISIAPWARLYKTSFLKQNHILFLITPIGEDVYFNLQANSLANKIKIISYIGYNWYQNSGSVTNTISDKIKNVDIVNLLNTHYNILKEKKCLNNDQHLVTIYFFLLIIQFLQWLCYSTTIKEISNYYDTFFQWFKEKFPDYKRINYFKSTKGDRLKIRLIILVMISFNRIYLGKIPVYLFNMLNKNR